MKWKLFVLPALLTVQAALLSHSAFTQSIVVDETGHFAAGLYHWEFQKFDLYCVNPPLVRLWATAPVAGVDYRQDWTSYRSAISDRSEFYIGRDFVSNNPETFLSAWQTARLTCIPFALLGSLSCFLMARDLFGSPSAYAAAVLWSFSPMVLGHGSLITPDVASATFSALTVCAYLRWLKHPTMIRALLIGLAMGVSLLTKFTCLLLVPIVAVGHSAVILQAFRGEPRGNVGWLAIQLPVWLLLALVALNIGYLGDGTLTPLGQFQFSSDALSGRDDGGIAAVRGNMFQETILHSVPIPVPQDYVLGIDHLKYELERGYWSYLRKSHRFGGWYHYYAYALLVKLPLGVWCLLLMAAVRATVLIRRGDFRVRGLTVVMVPAVLIFLSTSSQLGFNHHLRYLLPLFPFLFVFAASAFAEWRCQPVFGRAVRLVALTSVVVSSLGVYPHSLAFFNCAAGGPERGWVHLSHSNVDWGQGLILLKEWQDHHPEARPLFVQVSAGFVPPEAYGIRSDGLPLPFDDGADKHDLLADRYPPGWYALGIGEMQTHSSRIRRFLETKPVERLGYTIWIYHLEDQTPHQAPYRASAQRHCDDGGAAAGESDKSSNFFAHR